MGYWKLKPKEELDSWRCLEATEETIEDFITWDTKDGQLTEVDREHIWNLIREGYIEGQVNDWDREVITEA